MQTLEGGLLKAPGTHGGCLEAGGARRSGWVRASGTCRPFPGVRAAVRMFSPSLSPRAVSGLAALQTQIDTPVETFTLKELCCFCGTVRERTDFPSEAEERKQRPRVVLAEFHPPLGGRRLAPPPGTWKGEVWIGCWKRAGSGFLGGKHLGPPGGSHPAVSPADFSAVFCPGGTACGISQVPARRGSSAGGSRTGCPPRPFHGSISRTLCVVPGLTAPPGHPRPGELQPSLTFLMQRRGLGDEPAEHPLQQGFLALSCWRISTDVVLPEEVTLVPPGPDIPTEAFY
ncbi:uncharacterized protein LOC141561842 [Sminthopsis crassicaudata]|uniref:uncharacterized protein LOC141561842 n=1 Tax=Sminthopsis crassicaudata TaxID=9301 RepID=UPI003D69833A